MISTGDILRAGAMILLCLLISSTPLDAHCSNYTPKPKRPPGTPGEKVPTGPGASTPRPPGWESSPRPKVNPDDADPALQQQSWTVWWELNREKLLGLDAIRTRRALSAIGEDEPEPPSRESLCAALMRAALDKDPDLATSAIVALGKARYAGTVTLLMDLAVAKETHPSVHESALLALGLVGDRSPAVVPFLLRVLLDKERHPCIRGCAAIGLGLADGPKTGETLFSLANELKCPQELAEACLIAAGLLSAHGMQTICSTIAKPLQGHLSNRLHAAMGVGRAVSPLLQQGEHEKIVGNIRRLLLDGPPEARGQATLTLGALGASDPKTRSALVALLASKGDPLDRAFAAVTLGELGAPESIEPLVRAWRDPDSTVAAHTALGLGLLAGRTSDAETRELIATLISEQLREQPDADLRGALVISIALSGHRAAAEPLLALLSRETEPFLQGVAAQALGILGVQEACAPIRDLLSLSPDPRVRRHAAWALGVMADRKAEAVLLTVLTEDAREYVRGQAAVALGGFRTPESSRALYDILSNSEAPGTLRAFAAVGLGRSLDVHSGRGLDRLRDHIDVRRAGELLRELQSYY